MLGSTSADRDRVDPAETLLHEVGAQLRQARLDRDEDLDAVAQHLRIKPAYLFGIEQGDLSGLPGRTYALGFLRTYADYLGFDGEDLVTRIKSSVGELPDRSRLRLRTPMPENRLPKTPMVVISLAVVVGVYVGWSYVNRTDRTVMEIVAEVPADLRERASDVALSGPGDGSPAIAASAPEAVAPPGAASGATDGVEVAEEADALGPGGATAAARSVEPAPVVATQPVRQRDDAAEEMTGPLAPQTGPPADPQLAQRGRDALTVQPAAGGEGVLPAPAGQGLAVPERTTPQPVVGPPPEAAVVRPAPAVGLPAGRSDEAAGVDPGRQAVTLLLDSAARSAEGAPQVFERTNTDARVILRARERAWIQVSSPAGDYTFTRTLEPGEAILVPNRPDLELWTGNAAGLEIIVDGGPVALPPGRMVRRNLSLDPDRLLADSVRPR
jgi:cytoskeleton protein RodZ